MEAEERGRAREYSKVGSGFWVFAYSENSSEENIMEPKKKRKKTKVVQKETRSREKKE